MQEIWERVISRAITLRIYTILISYIRQSKQQVLRRKESLQIRVEVQLQYHFCKSKRSLISSMSILSLLRVSLSFWKHASYISWGNQKRSIVPSMIQGTNHNMWLTAVAVQTVAYGTCGGADVPIKLERKYSVICNPTVWSSRHLWCHFVVAALLLDAEWLGAAVAFERSAAVN